MVQSQPGRSKKSYRPRLQFLSATEYLIPSERYGGYILYQVTVQPSGHIVCECSAGEHGKPCKHVRLVKGAHAYRQSPMHIRPMIPAYNGAAGLLEAFGP